MSKLIPTMFFVIVIFISSSSADNILTSEQESQLATLTEILHFIYEDDPTAIPTDANDVVALETSTESRDMLAFALIQMMQQVLNGKLDITAPHMEDTSTSLEATTVDKQSIVSEENIETDSAVSVYSTLNFPLPMTMNSEQATDLSGPLGSCILESQTYRITELPLQIEGHVVIPAGTRLIAPFDPNNAVIEVMPGGLLDMGNAVFYDANNCPDILPPVEIIPEEPNELFIHNYIGISIHRGADVRTRIGNTIIKNCSIGIRVNATLLSPVQGVITFGCYDGVHLYAPAAIHNCEFWYNGAVSDGIFNYVGAGIYVYPDIIQYPSPIIDISQTVMYDGDVGLYFDTMVSDPNLVAPDDMIARLNVVNSCFATSYFYGIYKGVEDGIADISHCAFGGNQSNANFGGSFTECINLPSNPFYNRQEDWEKLYVHPLSPMIDAGYGPATDGMGVMHDQPDTGIMDIGCHFPLGLEGAFGIQSSPADFNWDGIVDEKDLELMNACMGAVDDPNIVRMDFNYDSRINMPDFAQFASDYGYCGDPNICTNTDPNCTRSDFDSDDYVDIEDLSILAEYWLAPVFDEYRLCSLCNLHTGVDPNDPNGLSGDHIIDQRDMDAFMADWMKGFVLNPSISFYDKNDQIIDPNYLSGIVTINVDEYPDSTRGFFIQVDGMAAVQTYPYSSAPPSFEIPTYQFSNNRHSFTIGGYLSDGGCWIKKVPVQFDNKVYLATIPDMYEPNELYEMTGFFDDGTVEVSTEPNLGTLFDNGYIGYASTISTSDNAQLTIEYENGEISEMQTFALLAMINMSKKDPNSYRALIVAPDKNANEDFEITLNAIRNALESNSISYLELLGKNANWDNVSIALRGSNLNYVYWIGHTNSQIGETRFPITLKVREEGVHRTNFKCWEKRRFWPDSSEGRIFSCLSSDGITQPAVPEPLPDDWETRGHSMWSLRLWETKTIKEFWAIGCETGLEWVNAEFTYPLTNDMAAAVGAYYTDQQGNHVHVYMGNRTPVWSGGLLDQALSYPSAIAHIIQRHSNHDLEDALINGPQDSNERKAVWGLDLDRDGLTDNVLQWWPLDSKLDWIHFF